MKLTASPHNKDYQFDVIPFTDLEEQRLYFLVQMPDKGFMLAEKVAPKGNWHQVGGGAFAADLQDAIFNAIDSTSINKLFEDERPFDELNNYYFNSLKNSRN